MRGCVDLRKPNSCIRYEHFQDGGASHYSAAHLPQRLITKVDLSDFYMHFLIGQADRRYMRFMWEGKKYECIGMPFGLAPALRLATKMMAPVIRYLDRALNNHLYRRPNSACRSYKESMTQTQLLVGTLHNLGFGIHPDKAQVIPSRSSEFWAQGEQQENAVLSASRQDPFDRRRSEQSSPKNELGTLMVRKFCSLLGKLNSLSGVVVSAQLHLWPLHHLMRQQLMRAAYKDLMHLNSQVIEEMQWWHDKMHHGQARRSYSAKCQMVSRPMLQASAGADGGDPSATPASSRTRLKASCYHQRRA